MMRSMQMVLGAPTPLLILAAPTAPAAVSVTAAAEPAVSASASTRVLVARRATVDFKSKRVGTENYKRTKITNSGPVTVSLLVSAGLPDDFAFGLMPGSTCPVLAPAPMAPGEPATPWCALRRPNSLSAGRPKVPSLPPQPIPTLLL